MLAHLDDEVNYIPMRHLAERRLRWLLRHRPRTDVGFSALLDGMIVVVRGMAVVTSVLKREPHGEVTGRYAASFGEAWEWLAAGDTVVPALTRRNELIGALDMLLLISAHLDPDGVLPSLHGSSSERPRPSADRARPRSSMSSRQLGRYYDI